jgi:hypothetical protein
MRKAFLKQRENESNSILYTFLRSACKQIASINSLHWTSFAGLRHDDLTSRTSSVCRFPAESLIARCPCLRRRKSSDLVGLHQNLSPRPLAFGRECALQTRSCAARKAHPPAKSAGKDGATSITRACAKNATGDTMNSLRRFAFAALLALTSLNIAPSLASAQDAAQGRFTLSHEVQWENATIPAGEYRFSLAPEHAGRLLTLSELTGTRQAFFLAVHDSRETKTTDRCELVVKTATGGARYVSTMQLPESGMTLIFSAPSEKQIARASMPVPAGQ